MRVRGHAQATPCWAELSSHDPVAAKDFYCGLFSWRALPTEAGSTVFAGRDGLVTAGMVPAAEGDHPSVWLTYLATEDIEATVPAAAAAGGTVLRPPVEVGARGQAALVVDTAGAVFGLWQAGTFRGAQVVNEPGAVTWSELVVRDLAEASKFYGKVFDWTDQPSGLVVDFDHWEWTSYGRVVAGLSRLDDQYPAEIPAHWHTIFEVDNCSATVARCAELGGRTIAGPIDVDVGQYARFVDPAGADFGVIEVRPEFRLAP